MAHKQLADTQQRTFEKVIEQIFPNENISSNVRTSEFKNPLTGSAMEIDVWIPSLHVCFEFQDMHHYATTDYYQWSLSQVQQTDYIKSHVARRQDFTLIEIAYWWNGLSESIIGTIQFFRPDLLPHATGVEFLPISLNPPLDFFEKIRIPHVGELMLASFPPISSHFSDIISPSNSWWIGEKYDGILSCWNSANSTLYTRAGNKLEIPGAVTQQMPLQFLNSEIWFGRGSYGKAIRWLRNTDDTGNWFSCRILAFDDPSLKGQSDPFEERYARLVTHLDPLHPLLILAMRTLCTTKNQLSNFLKDVLGDGGEGAILRLPKSPYVPGRSPHLVKLKAVRTDQEALVIYKDKDHISLLTCSGTVIDQVMMMMTMEEAGREPERGEVVTFSYQAYTKGEGSPSSPKIHRVREDVDWADVLREGVQARSGNLNESSGKSFVDPTLAKDVLTHAETTKKLKRRFFFQRYAKVRNLNPLQANTWYNISGVEFKREKGAEFVLGPYNGSYMRAVADLFPEINFDPRLFTKVPHSYWKNVDNRKEFFKSFADENSFDPLNPTNWYSSGIKKMLEKKGASSLFINYYGNYRTALMHLFPDIGLDVNKFSTIADHHWENIENQRELLFEFAKANLFDPLVASHWYSVRLKDFASFPKGTSMLASYKGNFMKALMTCLPDIGLSVTKFPSIPHNYFNDESRRRDLLKQFAQSRAFDIDNTEEWYKISMEEFLRFKQGARAVLKLYEGSLVNALLHLLPDLPWDKSKFFKIPRNYCSNADNRRQLMEEIARERGFDPLVAKNWYSVTNDMIASAKGGRTVLSYYGSNVSNAVIHLFPDIGIDQNMFHVAKYYWSSVENRRSFCEEFARRNGFNPKITKNWQLVRKKDFIDQGGGSMLAYHQGNFIKAITQLFQ